MGVTPRADWAADAYRRDPAELALHLSWVGLCLISTWGQVGHVLLYIRSKPIVQITLNDRVHCDMLQIYRISVLITVVTNVLLTSETTVHLTVAFVLSHSSDLLSTVFVLYLSVSAVVQYSYVKFKTVNIFEDIDEDRILRFIRLTIGTLSALVVGVRCLHGAYSIYFPILLRQNMDVRMHLSVGIMGFLLLASLVVNVTLRTIIFIERRRSKFVCGGGSSNAAEHPAAVKFAFLALFLMIVIVINVASKIIPGFYRIGSDLLFGMMSIVVPASLIVFNPKIKYFAVKRLRDKFEEFIRILPKNAISPENDVA